MAEAYYDTVAGYRIRQLDAAYARCSADIMQAESNGDYEQGAELAATMGNIIAEKNNLLNLHAMHAQSKQPRYQVPLTAAEKDALPVEKMDPFRRK